KLPHWLQLKGQGVARRSRFYWAAMNIKCRKSLNFIATASYCFTAKTREATPNEKAPAKTGAFRSTSKTRRLLERGLDAGESRVQLRAEALHDRDDCNRDASGDEAILDGG